MKLLQYIKSKFKRKSAYELTHESYIAGRSKPSEELKKCYKAYKDGEDQRKARELSETCYDELMGLARHSSISENRLCEFEAYIKGLQDRDRGF